MWLACCAKLSCETGENFSLERRKEWGKGAFSPMRTATCCTLSENRKRLATFLL